MLITNSWHLFIYSIKSFFVELIPGELISNASVSNICDIAGSKEKLLVALIDLFNSTLLPFIAMIYCMLQIVRSIYKARKRISDLRLAKSRWSINVNSNHQAKKDLKFSLTIMTLNVLFALFNLPICMCNVFCPSTNDICELFDLMFYLQYSFNFVSKFNIKMRN